MNKFIITEEQINKVKEAENESQLLSYVYKYIFDVDLNDPNISDKEITPWHYKLSMVLANELIEYSVNTYPEGRDYAAMIWLNWSPSACQDLKRNEISIDKEARYGIKG